MKNATLLVIDAQMGFSPICPDELPVPTALDIVPNINKLLEMPWKLKIATQDWHPYDHCSFVTSGGPFNRHCVENTIGSMFLPELHTDKFNIIARKGYHKDTDSLSAIPDNSWLYNISDEIYLAGICTNICVVLTGMDLFDSGPERKIYIIEDACATLDVPVDNPYNADKMKKQAIEMGIKYISIKELQWTSQ
jgi:nicotinamidase/pyrazinamidase